MSSEIQNNALEQELINEFFGESLESLEGLDNQLIHFEGHPTDLLAINAIFRPIHSIKGNSAFFGLLKIKKLAHELENLLDLLRKRHRTLTPPLMAVLLKGFDTLRTLFLRLRDGGVEIARPDELDALLVAIAAAAQVPETPATVWPQLVDKLDRMFRKLRHEDRSLVEEVEGLVSTLREQIPALTGTSNLAVKDGASGEVEPLRLLRHAAREPFEKTDLDVRAQQAAEALDGLHALCQENPEAAARVAKARATFDTFMKTVGFDSLLANLLREAANALAGMAGFFNAAPPPAKAEARLPPTVAEPAPPDSPADSYAKSGGGEKTLRVSEKQIDAFLAYVGELVVVGEMFNHLHANLGGDAHNREIVNQFRYVNETFADLSGNLQRSIMALRRVPLKPVLGKAPRLARDVAVQNGKEIQVLVEDNDVSVDKSIHDMLDAPLTHIVRNAADHGIESPDVRVAAGKPRQGTITVSAIEDADNIRIAIQDDGAGLDIEALRHKAAAMGLLPTDREPSWNEIVQVLFEPGVSTSKKVTDISGRGVGMDVVKRAVEARGGSITVDSTSGKGSTFSIVLSKSVSTQILRGFLVRVAQNILVLPMEKIMETAQIEADSVTSVSGRGRCIQRHGRVCPLLDLGQILELPAAAAAQQQTVVVVAVQDQRLALVVDELLGVQQVVVKPIEGLDGLLEGFSGGALMGNGSIALVMDLDTMKLANRL